MNQTASLHGRNRSNFDQRRATEYDEKSHFDKGDRARHAEYFQDILGFLDLNVERFIELGCGTGFYTELLLEQYQAAAGLVLDDSAEMLNLARKRLANCSDSLEFRQGRVEEDGKRWPHGVELVFAGVVLCYLDSSSRERVIESVFDALSPGGVFILFDQHRPLADEDAKLNEYLACSDMRRRLGAHLKVPLSLPSLSIEALMAADRKSKLEDGDNETSIEDHLRVLGKVGFEHSYLAFMEPRLFGVVARKGRGAK